MSRQGIKAYQLTELGSISRGRSRHRPRDDDSLYGGKYPFIQTGDVKSANLYLSSYTQTYNESGLSQSKIWNAGTLCITIAANIAETAILGIDACFPDSIVGFIPFDGVSDVRYIKYYFDIYKKQMQAMSLGATQDNFSIEKMLSVKFLLPNYCTQVQIADILSAYDDAIENNNRRIALLEKAAQELYKEWFVRFRFPGYENTKFVNGLPEGWEYKRIGDIAYVNPKLYSPRKTDSTIAYIDISSIDKGKLGGYSYLLISDAPSRARRQIQPMDIIYSTVRPNLKGYRFVVSCPSNAIASTGFAVVRAIKKYDSLFIYHTLTEDAAVDYFAQIATGTSYPAIVGSDIEKLKILLPTAILCEGYWDVASSFYKAIDKCERENQNLAKQRDLLLPRLMSGRLEV